MKFLVEGEMSLGRERRKFTKEVEAPSEGVARERVYAEMGSRHGLNRRRVKITSVGAKQ
ncbi:MAG: 50S ribosomal protein L18Ae [Candidatus Micrarchaeota archaeon]